MTEKIARYENIVRPPPGMEEIDGTKKLEFHESFFDYIVFEPSTPGPGKIPNDPTNGDMHNPASKMRSFRYQVYNEWLDVLVFLPENILNFTNECTPVIVHLGSGVGDYFHYYNGNRGREKYFPNPNMDWYNKNCIIISLDYFVQSDKAKRFYINPNESLIKNVLEQISSRYPNKKLRYLSGHSRGAQSALITHMNNPIFSNKVFMTELMITDNPNTRFDEQRAKYIMSNLPEDSKLMVVNGTLNYYHSQNMEAFLEKHENFELQIIDGYGTVCHQYGILESFKPKIEQGWNKEMERLRLQ